MIRGVPIATWLGRGQGGVLHRWRRVKYLVGELMRTGNNSRGAKEGYSKSSTLSERDA